MTTEDDLRQMGLLLQSDGTWKKVSMSAATQNEIKSNGSTNSTFPQNLGAVRVQLKALSINKAYKGRRFSTPEKKVFTHQVALMLPNIYPLPAPPFRIYFKFGLSSSIADGDNCIKVTQDCIARKYKFNDKLIRGWVIDTEIVKKGEEYFEFKIESYDV